MTVNEQRIKNSNKGFDILYRVVTALIAAATFPITVFTSLFYFAYTIPYFSIISQNAEDTGASYFSASIYDLLTKYRNPGSLFGDSGIKFDFADVFTAVKPQLIAIGCLYGALLVLALAIIIFAVFTKKKLPIVVFSALGVGVLAFIPFAFGRLSAPFLDGTLNIDSFLHTGLSNILDFVVKVDFIRAGEAYTFLWVVFIALLAWTGAVMLVNMGDEPKEKKKKDKKPKRVKEPKEKKVEE